MFLSDLTRLLTFQDANTRTVMLGAALLGLAAGTVGCFAVLRRRSLVGDAVAHASLPGVCAAYLLIGDRHLGIFLLGALAFGILAAALIAFIRSWTRIKEDAAIGIAIGSFFGLGITLSTIIQKQPGGNRAGLDSFILGKAASMVAADARLISLAAAGILLLIAVFYKQFKLICFDREFAGAIGWKVGLLDLFLMALVCVCTVVGLPAVGIVMIVALLVIPAAAARFWTDRLGLMLVIAGSIGALAGILGTALSAVLPVPSSVLSTGWPTGPLIVLVAATVFIASFLLAPRRGVLADWIRRIRLHARVGSQNLLRAIYEHLEPANNLTLPFSPSALRLATALAPNQLERDVARAASAGWLERTPDGRAKLTQPGIDAAQRTVRAHRLWELFLVEQAGIAPDHVDRDADEIEHFLPPDLLARLEARLKERGRWPQSVPASPHPVESAPAPSEGSRR